MAVQVLHLKTQQGQPFGSERRCCERCGVMIWSQVESPPRWTADEGEYLSPPEGFIRCTDTKSDSA
jgi:hypothetical protein